MDIFSSSKNKGDALPNSASDANPTITTEEQKNIITIALKLELQDILSKKNLYEPVIIEHVKKLISLCVRPFSDTLNIKDLSQDKKWATIKEIYIKPQKSETQKPILPQVLSHQVNENILIISKIITNFLQINKHNITSPFISFNKLDLRQELDSDMFWVKYYSLIQSYLPKKILNKSPVQKTEETFFPALKEIEELKEAYIKYSNDHLNMVCSFLEIIRKFYKGENIKDKISFQEILGNYVYFLNQQWKALSFCKKLYPQSIKFKPLQDVIEEAKKILIEENLLDQSILDIKLKPQEQKKYYEEALEWLDKLTGPQVEVVVVAINEIKANAHYYLGMIYENSKLELDWFRAIREYINALEIDKNFNFLYGHDTIPDIFSNICKKIGDLFLALGKWCRSENENGNAIKLIHEAIKYFKVRLCTADIEDCSRTLQEIFSILKNKREEKAYYISLEKDLYKSLADFLFKSNLMPQAALEYDRASSRTDDDEEVQELLSSKLKASETKMEENTAFLRSTLAKGKKEDLSMFAKEADRAKFFSDTHVIINGFVPLPESQAKEWPKVQQNQNEQLPNDQKELTKQDDTQLQEQKEALVQPQQTQSQHQQPQPTENTPLRTIENIQEPDYWYTEDDIKNILEANIDKNKFSIVHHVNLTNPEMLRDTLKVRVSDDLIRDNKVVLMPINTGHGHWVSMMISKDNNTNKIIFTYNDPLGTPLNNRPNLVKLITEACLDAEIRELKIRQQDNTSDCGVFVCDDLIRQSQGLEILSTEQCKGQGLNLRKSQAESLKQNLINQQPQQQHVYINADSNISDDEENAGNNNSDEEEAAPPPYGNDDEVNGLGDVFQLND